MGSALGNRDALSRHLQTSASGRDRVLPLGRRKLTLAGRTGASKVSLPAWPRTHTTGQKQSSVRGGLRASKMPFSRRTIGEPMRCFTWLEGGPLSHGVLRPKAIAKKRIQLDRFFLPCDRVLTIRLADLVGKASVNFGHLRRGHFGRWHTSLVCSSLECEPSPWRSYGTFVARTSRGREAPNA